MKRNYTADEYLSMNELEGRYELVNGEIYDMSPAPSITHQRLSRRINRQIEDHIINHCRKCEVFQAPTDVKLDEENVVQPDIFVVCDPAKLDEKKCCGAPDWVIEISSPSSAKRDAQEKLYLYERSGVREYWIVDPEAEKVVVYPFGTTRMTGIYTFDDEIPVGIYGDTDPPLMIKINDK